MRSRALRLPRDYAKGVARFRRFVNMLLNQQKIDEMDKQSYGLTLQAATWMID